MSTIKMSNGELLVYVTEPTPRFVHLYYGQTVLTTLTLGEVRDLKILLEQVLDFVKDDVD